MNGRHFRYVLRATQVSESLNDRSEQKFITRIKLSALGKADILRAHEFACLLLPKPDKMMRCSQCIFPAKSGPTEKSLTISSRRRHQDHGGTALRGYPGLGDRSTPSEPVSLGIVNRCWGAKTPWKRVRFTRGWGTRAARIHQAIFSAMCRAPPGGVALPDRHPRAFEEIAGRNGDEAA